MTIQTLLPTADPRKITRINLDRALSRLETKILSPTSIEAQSRLQHSHFERVQTSGSLEYARTLLLRLEHDSSALKIQSQKTAAQTSLSAHRALIKRLRDRLRDFERTGDDSADYYQDGSEDLLAKYEAEDTTTVTTAAGNATKPPQSLGERERKGGERHPNQASDPQPRLRNRFHLPETLEQNTALTTSASTTTNPLSTSNKTTLLESATTTQEALTTSLLSLSSALKKSSQSFSASLEADTANLDRAVEGLDRNASGMDAAGGRMGMLKRMSEGRGLWGRWMLYAWIAGLWVVAVVLVGVVPKLRF